MSIRDLEILADFFGSYFHQDWMYEVNNTSAAVASYLQTADPVDVVRLRDAILNYANSIDNDTELEELLFSKLGCYYSPSVDGRSAREWVLEVADILGKNIR